MTVGCEAHPHAALRVNQSASRAAPTDQVLLSSGVPWISNGGRHRHTGKKCVLPSLFETAGAVPSKCLKRPCESSMEKSSCGPALAHLAYRTMVAWRMSAEAGLWGDRDADVSVHGLGANMSHKCRLPFKGRKSWTSSLTMTARSGLVLMRVMWEHPADTICRKIGFCN